MASKSVLVQDDFSRGLQNWTETTGGGHGKWYTRQNTLFWDGISSGNDNRVGVLLTKKEVSGQIDAVECDTCFIFPDHRPLGAYNGFFLCMCYEGHYLARVAYNPDGAEAEPRTVFQILKRRKNRNSYTLLAESADLNTALGLGIGSGVWFHLQVTLTKGKIAAYINGVRVLTYYDIIDPFTKGQVALRPTHCDAQFKNVLVCGQIADLTPNIYIPPALPPQTYAYTFENEPLGKRPAAFCEAIHKSNWAVTEQNGQRLLATHGHHSDSCLWLHGYEENPTVRARLYAQPVDGGARAGIFARYGVDGSYIEAGYDFDRKRWYLCYKQGQNFEETYVYADETADFDTNVCHPLTAAFIGNRVTVQDGDQTVLDIENVPYISWGRCGIFSHYTAVALRSFACDFPAGGKVTPGVESATFWPDEYLNFLEIERINDTDVLAFTFLKRMLSTDKGKTFTDVSDLPEWQMVNYDSDYTSILKMQNGEFLMFNGIDDFKVYHSADMQSWTYLTQVLPTEEQYDAFGKKLAILHVSTPTEFTLPNGIRRIFMPVCFRHTNERGAITGHYTRVYYSDDAGHSWTPAADSTKRTVGGDEPDSSISELKVILCADGNLRMYSTRNGFGCAGYFISYDNGVTWPEFVQIPQLPCAMSSFGVAADPAHPGHYFMVYVKGIPYSISTLFPRTHLVLLHSTDGIHWEELADIDRFTRVDGTPASEPYQILDPSITVCEDYIYVGWGRSSKGEPNFHNAQRARYLRIDRATAGF